MVSSITGDLEELIEEFLKNFILLKSDVATATKIRVDKEDLAQFIWQYGHLACAEEHFADYIKEWVAKLQKAKNTDEKMKIQEKVVQLSNFLYSTRLIRKKYLTGFLQRIGEKGKEKIIKSKTPFAKEITTTLPEASDYKAKG